MGNAALWSILAFAGCRQRSFSFSAVLVLPRLFLSGYYSNQRQLVGIGLG